MCGLIGLGYVEFFAVKVRGVAPWGCGVVPTIAGYRRFCNVVNVKRWVVFGVRVFECEGSIILVCSALYFKILFCMLSL